MERTKVPCTKSIASNSYPSLEVKSVVRRCVVPLHAVVAHIVATTATPTCCSVVIAARTGRCRSALLADSAIAVFNEAAMMNCTSFFLKTQKDIYYIIIFISKSWKKQVK